MTAARETVAAILGDVHSGWCAANPYYREKGTTHPCHCRLTGVEDALVEAMEKLAAERAAEELRAAVAREQAIHGALSGNVSLFADRLRARAAALAPEEGR